MPGNRVNRSTYLSTDDVGVSQGAFVRLGEVLRDGHLSSLTKREREVIRTSATQPLDDPRPGFVHCARVRFPGKNSDSSKKALEFDSLSIGETSARGQRIKITMANKLPAEIKQVSWFVHDAGGDIDVNEHAANCWANGLEVSAPKYKTVPDVLGLLVGEERTNVEGIF